MPDAAEQQADPFADQMIALTDSLAQMIYDANPTGTGLEYAIRLVGRHVRERFEVLSADKKADRQVDPDKPVGLAEGIHLARSYCLKIGGQLRESGDPQKAARGRAIRELLPPFFDWMHVEATSGVPPRVASAALAEVMGLMLANLGASATDRERLPSWLEAIGTLAINRALHEYRSNSGKIPIDRGVAS